MIPDCGAHENSSLNALIVFAHPEPTSFNAAMKDAAVTRLTDIGYNVEISDLYAEKFDPVEKAEHYRDRLDDRRFAALAEQRYAGRRGSLAVDVRREIRRLERADLVILQFPLWWHAQPAILKGWFDRVFVNGLLYSSAKRYDRGHFRGERAVLSVTTGAPEPSFGPGGRGGDIELLLWPIQYSLHYMGFSVLQPSLAFGVSGHGYHYDGEVEKHARLDRYLQDWIARLTGLLTEAPLVFPGWDDWGDEGQMRCGVDPRKGLRFRGQSAKCLCEAG